MTIGITGQKQVGKDTIANYLGFGYGFKRMGFADKLKESFAALFDLELDELEQMKNSTRQTIWLDEPTGQKTLSWRELLQRYGTESHRDVFGENFWIDALFMNPDFHGKVVVPDVRFPNEAKAIKTELDGIIVEVKRDTGLSDDHVSESGIWPEVADYVIVNDGSIHDLYKKVDLFMVGDYQALKAR